jgi:hypothetical protein
MRLPIDLELFGLYQSGWHGAKALTRTGLCDARAAAAALTGTQSGGKTWRYRTQDGPHDFARVLSLDRRLPHELVRLVSPTNTRFLVVASSHTRRDDAPSGPSRWACVARALPRKRARFMARTGLERVQHRGWQKEG